MVAQLATARAAATTSSSFILIDTWAEKAKRSPVTCRKPHRLRLFHFSFVSHTMWRWASHAPFHCINSVSRFLWTSVLSLPQLLYESVCSPAVQEVCVLLCSCVCCYLCCSCLPASMSVCGEVRGMSTCRRCRAVLERCSYIAVYSYDLQCVQSGGCQPLIKSNREGR